MCRGQQYWASLTGFPRIFNPLVFFGLHSVFFFFFPPSCEVAYESRHTELLVEEIPPVFILSSRDLFFS